MLAADVQKVVKAGVERVLTLIAEHPADEERAAPAHDIRDPALLLQPADGLHRDAAVDRDEVNAILRIALDHAE